MRRIGILVALLAASPAWASPPAERDTAAAAVQSQLVRPMADREARRSRFSRARPAPTARRVRILDDTPLKDDKGAAFVRFAIDTRRGFLGDGDGGDWKKDAEVGCVYLEPQRVFVRVAERHYPVAYLLGKQVDPADANICHPTPEVAAAAPR